ATTKADLPFFAGLRVNGGGRPILTAARRVRELAKGADTVLVLPEDPSLVALIGRPRPPLCGGIVFVDQYPAWCLTGDLAYLDAHPPKVLVGRPSDVTDWLGAFRSFNQQSPAELLILTFVWTHLTAYKLDSSYQTEWGPAGTG